MSKLFELSNTYEMLLDFGSTTRPIRIEIFRGIENINLFRARIWDQCTYNLFPTFLNIDLDSKKKIYSSDEINREITLTIAEEPNFITGKEYLNEKEFLKYIKSLIIKYQDALNK